MIGGILLAGGSSSRFDGDKRMAQLASGRTLLEQSIINAAAKLAALIVVIRNDDEALEQHLRSQVAAISGASVSGASASITVVRARDSALGMAHSMVAGFAAIPPGWSGAMVLLADMPFLRPETFVALTSAFEEKADEDPIVVPVYNAQPGHPVTFAARWFGEIRKLSGDEGARRIVRAHSSHVVKLSVPDPGILQDIDTRSGLAAILPA